MKKAQINPMPEYFDRYINKTDDVTLLEALNISLTELENLTMDKYKAIGDKVYAPGKWTIKDLFQHILDTERIFCYRALAISRGEEQKLLSYDEDLYAKNAHATNRNLDEIINELKLVRQTSIALFKSFTPEMLLKTGEGFKGKYSVLAIGFMLPGHQRWHVDVIKERYWELG